MTEVDLIHKDLVYRIVGCAMEVHRELSYGFLEKVYENAMMVQLKKEGIKAEQQHSISVNFSGVIVGEYFADIMVEDIIIIELKALESIANTHYAQVLNYLKATRMQLGLLINLNSIGNCI